MNRTVQGAFGTSIALLVAALAGPAAAQPGDHVRVGEGQLVPKLELSSIYRSNVYLREIDSIGGLALGVTPSLELDLESKDMMLSAGGTYEILKYLDSELSNLDRFRDGRVDLDLSLLPGAVVGVRLVDNFESVSRASEASWADTALITQLSNVLGGFVAIHPGSALDIQVGARHGFDDYRVPEEVNIDRSPFYNSRNGYGPVLDAKWRFFPRTAVVLKGGVEWFQWRDNVVDISSGLGARSTEGSLGIPDGMLWTLSGGLRGRVTDRVALNLIVGYNAADYDESTVSGSVGPGESLDSSEGGYARSTEGMEGVMGTVSMDYALDEGRKVTVGYDRALRDSWFTNFMVYDYGFVRGQALLSSRLGVQVEGGYRFESYFGDIERQDHVVRLRGATSYAGNQWLDVSVGGGWDRRASANRISAVEFDDIHAFVSMTATY